MKSLFCNSINSDGKNVDSLHPGDMLNEDKARTKWLILNVNIAWNQLFHLLHWNYISLVTKVSQVLCGKTYLDARDTFVHSS